MPYGTPEFRSVPFFWLLCSNNYSKIFQKRRIFKLLLEGAQVGYPIGGPPQGPLEPPEGPPDVTEFWKKMQKFLDII